jgi:hypothetical protein
VGSDLLTVNCLGHRELAATVIENDAKLFSLLRFRTFAFGSGTSHRELIG